MRRLLVLSLALAATISAHAQQVLTGQNAFTDYSKESPGIRRHITAADLPAPYATPSSSNAPRIAPKPADAWPKAPTGFKVELYAQGGDLRTPRLLLLAPNGDLFLADTGSGNILIYRGVTADGKPQQTSVFATGLRDVFGLAFYPANNPQWLYVSNTNTVMRIPYHSGDLKATAAPQTLITGIPGGGHTTRGLTFTADGKHLLVAVGSGSNIDNPDTHASEFHRANVLEYSPDGKFEKVYASGIRNCVGLTLNPTTGQPWCSVNERDELGDNLVPDYITSVKEGGFYGWPWYYIGDHKDPRLPQPCADGSAANQQLAAPLTAQQASSCQHTDVSSKVLVPDVLLQPHFASLELTFYPTTGGQFPAGWHGEGIAAEHGSWNKAKRGGYEVIRVPMKNGHATGEFEDFLTGFVTADGQVWGRPVGVAIAKDGSLFVSDDGYRAIWHITYTGKR